MKPKTASTYKRDYAQYYTWCSDNDLKPGTSESMHSFIEYISHVSAPATVNRKIASLKHYHPDSDLHPIRIPDKPVRVFSIAEIISLRAIIESRGTIKHRTIFELLLNTGIRSQELVDLHWGNFDFINHNLLVQGKGDKIRTVPINSRLAKIMKEWRIFSSSSFRTDPQFKVFPNTNNTSTLRKMWYRIFLIARVINASVHTFRHTFATNTYDKTLDIKIVQDLLGHSNIHTTAKHYIHRNNDQKAAAVEGLAFNMGY